MSELVKGQSNTPGMSVYMYGRTMFKAAGADSSTEPKKKHTTLLADDNSFGEITPWALNNLFPQDILNEIKDVPVVKRGLHWEAEALYGGGIQVGKITGYKDDGSEIFQPFRFPEWEEFKKKSRISEYLMTACLDFYHFGIPFTEFRTTKGSSLTAKKIYSIKAQKAKNCRFGKMATDGTIKKVHLTTDWLGEQKGEKQVALLSPYDNMIEELKKSNETLLMFPSSYPTPGEDIYPLLPWTSMRKYWLPYAKLIPDIKLNILKRGANINLVVEIADWYWAEKYKDWDEKKELQEKRMETEMKSFGEFVSGSENSGKTIFTPGKTSPDKLESYPGWKFTVLDKGIGDGKWLDDSTEVSLQLMMALGWDPSMSGIIPGKTMNGTGGSDRRVAFNIYISMRQFDRDTILEPFYFIKNVNEWDESMEFRFKYPLITTLDKGKESQQQTS